MSNEGYDFKETSEIIEKIQNYKVDHVEIQYQSLETRFEVINQTYRGNGNPLTNIRVNKLSQQMTLLEEHYVNINNNSPIEEKVNVLALVNNIHKQIEKLEGKSGE